MKRILVGLLLTLMFCAQAQSTWPRQVLYQNGGAIIEARTPSNSILFSFEKNYPPASFPARFPATVPDNGILPFQLRSTVAGIWNLLIEIADLRDGSGRLLVPARQIMYRVNRGPWLRGNGAPQIIYTKSGNTRDWEEVRIEFQIELLGNEVAGVYAVQAYFSALTQP
jgi:hypothetical protein